MRELGIRFGIAFAICSVLAIGFGYLAASIQSDAIVYFDKVVISFVQGWEAPWLTTIMTFFTWVGSAFVVTPITIIVFLLLYFRWKKHAQAYLLVFVIVGTVSLNTLLKLYFKRERPEIHRIMDATGFSFPSGHTMMAFSLYAILGFIAWRIINTKAGAVMLILFVIFMTCIIAISRIYLGVHYPSDIVGGLFASGLWLTISIALYMSFQTRHAKKNEHLYET